MGSSQWIPAQNVTKVGYYLMADSAVEGVRPQWVEVWCAPFQRGTTGATRFMMYDEKGKAYFDVHDMSASILFFGPLEHPCAEY
jgi:hypothetical protein